MTDRIYDERYDYNPDYVLHVDDKVVDDKLVLTTIVEGSATSIQLDSNGVRALRLSLQRWERHHEKAKR